MSMLTRDEIVAALGRVEDHLITEILATGATDEEFAQARSWLANDEAPMNSGAPLASGRVARLIELLDPPEEDWPDDDAEPSGPRGASYPTYPDL